MSPVYVLDVSGQYREKVANGRMRGCATGEVRAAYRRTDRRFVAPGAFTCAHQVAQCVVAQ